MGAKKKDKTFKSKIFIMLYAISTMGSFIAELYCITNFSKQYVVIGAVGLLVAISFAFLVDEIISAKADNKSYGDDNQYLEEILKLQKAIYLNGKNITTQNDNFNELFEEKVQTIIDNEKSIAKVLIKKNKENSDAILEAVKTVEISIPEIPAPVVNVPEIKLPDITIPEIKVPDINVPEVKIPEIRISDEKISESVTAAKNEIIRLIEKLSEDIKNIQNMEELMSIKDKLSDSVVNDMVSEVEELSEPEEAESVVENIEPEVEESTAKEVEPEVEEPAVEEAVVEPEPIVEESVTEPEPVVEEIKVEPVSEDPNKQLSADEIAALSASVGASTEEPAVEETIVEPEPIVEETVTEPEPAAEEIKVEPVSEDPNKQLSADEIEALFASVGASTEEPVVEETVVEPEPIVEERVTEPEPVVEEIKVEPVSEDPNKQLSADEIAALFASIQ